MASPSKSQAAKSRTSRSRRWTASRFQLSRTAFSGPRPSGISLEGDQCLQGQHDQGPSLRRYGVARFISRLAVGTSSTSRQAMAIVVRACSTVTASVQFQCPGRGRPGRRPWLCRSHRRRAAGRRVRQGSARATRGPRGVLWPPAVGHLHQPEGLLPLVQLRVPPRQLHGDVGRPRRFFDLSGRQRELAVAEWPRRNRRGAGSNPTSPTIAAMRSSVSSCSPAMARASR